MLRTILALALASSVWAETICSREPTICAGTYSGTTLCAPLHRAPFTMHQRGGLSPAAGLGERRRGGTEGGIA